jgi:hypothetical protein
VFGSPGYNLTVNYLYDTIAKLGDYYDVQFQTFEAEYSDGTEYFYVDCIDQNATLMTYTTSGSVNNTVFVLVLNLGCM